MPGASPAAAEARGASRGLQRQGPPPPGSGPDAPSLHAPLGMDQQQGMPRPPPGFHISGPPPPGMQHQMHGMMQQGQMQVRIPRAACSLPRQRCAVP